MDRARLHELASQAIIRIGWGIGPSSGYTRRQTITHPAYLPAIARLQNE